MLRSRNQNQILASHLHHADALPVLKDRVLRWTADTSSWITMEPEMVVPDELLGTTSAWESAVLIHELTQPLSAIASNAEANLRWLTLETPNLSAARESAKKIIRDARAVASLVEGLKGLFRRTGPQKTIVDLNALICEVLCRLEDRIDEGGIATIRTSSPSSVYVHADSTQLSQVLHNLISNAIDAMEQTSSADRALLVHSSQQMDGTILVSVEDNGCGVENAERIFDPFFSTKDNGLGLGLWICRCIVQSHRGKLWAEKAPRRGTRLSFILPAR